MASTLDPAVPNIKFAALFDRVSVPPPLKATFAAPICSSVTFPVEFSEIAPALLIVLPLTVSVVPLAKLRLSVLNPRVRLEVAAPEIFSVTVEPAVLMHALVLLVGTPALQSPATFQFPMAAPVQLVSHCANAETGNKNSATMTSQRIRRALSVIRSFSRERKREWNNGAGIVVLRDS